jgi:maltose alpha-D-glucosyltransferase / alpha-amylase
MNIIMKRSIENQDKNPSSLLWWMRQVISTRKRYPAFSRGTIKFVNSNNPKVLAFIREYQDQTMLVIINLSHHSQSVNLELEEYSGLTPIEVFSLNHFPPIQDEPYSFTLQYRDYFWLQITKLEEEVIPEGEPTYPKLTFNRKEWNSLPA